MGKTFSEIDQRLGEWMLAQPVYFVSTAPLAADGHVNVSPKGMDGTFAVLAPNRVAYLDYFGSGAETIAHLRENGRIVVMFCAFSGPPKIVRLHGRGRVIRPGEAEFAELRAHFGKERDLGVRSIIVIDTDRISDSCGYSVPKMEYVADRDILDLHQLKKPAEYYEDVYAGERNATSIDGLPALANPQ
ncbi:Pyridoxamine 5'-phosphate oxidase [Frankineae bacterium MT45]|nr:Pyridoxamine 5'-phosphate oxidase [Frankineae bacterium MT45]